jgi:hypothetical protein
MRIRLGSLKRLIREECNRDVARHRIVTMSESADQNFFGTDRYLAGDFTNVESCELDELPPAVQATFKAILDSSTASNTCEDCDGSGELDGETCDMCDGEGKYPEEITYGQVADKDAFTMGVHDPTSPVNPSGSDFFASSDGTYVGYQES